MGGDVGEVKRWEGVKSVFGYGIGDVGDVVEGVDDEVASDAIFVSYRFYWVLRVCECFDVGDLCECSDVVNVVYGEKFDFFGEMFWVCYLVETLFGYVIGFVEVVD